MSVIIPISETSSCHLFTFCTNRRRFYPVSVLKSVFSIRTSRYICCGIEVFLDKAGIVRRALGTRYWATEVLNF